MPFARTTVTVYANGAVAAVEGLVREGRRSASFFSSFSGFLRKRGGG